MASDLRGAALGIIITLAIIPRGFTFARECHRNSVWQINEDGGCHGSFLHLFENGHSRSLNQATLPQVERDLLSAARDGDAEKVREALKQGATGNVPTPTQHFTPLLFAARGGHKEVVGLLLDAGVNVNWKTRSGVTALWTAAAYGHESVVSLLLIMGNADVDAADSDGRTPLYMACQEMHVEIVEMLLSKGADTEAMTASGITPLLAASQSGEPIVVEVLLTNGANINVQSRDLNKTALWNAAFLRHTDVVSILVKKGAKLNLASTDGSTPLFAAAQQGWHLTVSQLLDAGADINSKRNDGLTPLHIAAAYKHVQVVKLLVQSGADTTVKDAQGLTAADLVQRDDSDVAAELTEVLSSPPIDVLVRPEVPQPLPPKNTTPVDAMPPLVSSIPAPVTPQTTQEPLATQAASPTSLPKESLGQDSQAPTILSSAITSISTNTSTNSNRRKASKSKLAIIIPVVLLSGLLLLALVALLIKHVRKPATETERIVTKILEDSESSFQVHDGLDAYRHSREVDRLNSTEISDVNGPMAPRALKISFDDPHMGRTPHRFGMETHRSHILIDGPSSQHGSARNREYEDTKSAQDYEVANTWTWGTEDGPSGGGGGFVGSYRSPGLPCPSQSLPLDSSYLHGELQLDHELAKVEKIHFWNSGRFGDDTFMRAEGVLPIGSNARHPTDIDDSARNPKIVPATFDSADGRYVTDSDLNMTDEDIRRKSMTQDDIIVGKSSFEMNRREAVDWQRRPVSAEQCYNPTRIRGERISGSTVKMTADEGACSRAPGGKGERSRRVIRILYKM